MSSMRVSNRIVHPSEDCQELMTALQRKHGEIIMQPKTADELHDTLLTVNGLDDVLASLRPQLARISRMLELLEKWSHAVPREVHSRWYECIHALPELRDRAERWRGVFRRDLKAKWSAKISESAKTLEEHMFNVCTHIHIYVYICMYA